MVRLVLKDPNGAKKEIALKGYSYRSISDEIGVSNSYISQIMNGKKTPAAPIAKKICDVMGKEIEEWFDVILGNELPNS